MVLLSTFCAHWWQKDTGRALAQHSLALLASLPVLTAPPQAVVRTTTTPGVLQHLKGRADLTRRAGSPAAVPTTEPAAGSTAGGHGAGSGAQQRHAPPGKLPQPSSGLQTALRGQEEIVSVKKPGSQNHALGHLLVSLGSNSWIQWQVPPSSPKYRARSKQAALEEGSAEGMAGVQAQPSGATSLP